MDAVRITGLIKKYKETVAVDGLDLRVKEGEFFAFLGMNGAGKSTTISVMCGQTGKDAGEVFINGQNIDTDLDRAKTDIGVVFQNSVLDMQLSVRENLSSRAALYGILGRDFEKRLGELAALLEFEDILKRPVGKLSGGQRRRIDVARALIHSPKILILDEPTTGLDVQSRRLLWNVIKGLREEKNMTVFLTTHYMEEAADADYVVIIDSGRVAAEGTPLELKNRYTGDYITVYGGDVTVAEGFGYPVEKVGETVMITVPTTAAATELIVKCPEFFRDFEITKGKMDDVFLAVTGKALPEENV